MAIYDTFLFADPSEKDILLAKLIIEDHLVDHWFVVESAFANTGLYKGHHIKRILMENKEFHPYQSRITVVEFDENIISKVDGGSTYDDSTNVFNRLRDFKLSARHKGHYIKKFAELRSISDFLAYSYEERYRNQSRVYVRAETFYRDLTRPYILEIAKPGDFLLISDVDEILDGQTQVCKNQIRNLTSGKRERRSKFMRFVKRKRLWDYHNLDTTSFSYVPLVEISFLHSNPDFRFILMRQTTNAWTPYSELELIHEYSSCFTMAGLRLKYNYHSDLFFTSNEELELSLDINKNIGMPGLKPAGWCEFVDPIKDHQPLYIKENFEKLRTNVVDTDYQENRFELYPELFTYTTKEQLEIS